MSIQIKSDEKIKRDVLDELKWDTSVDETEVGVQVHIARAVRSALVWDVLVPDAAITSTVSAGVVTLQGTVDTRAERAHAQRSVQRLTGVRNVVNLIGVTAKAVDADELKRQIEEALERQAEREARRIGVTVEGGAVTLTGSVRSWAEKNAIERAVAFAPGVRLVDDRTIVDPYH